MRIRKKRRSSDFITGAFMIYAFAGMIIGALFLAASLLGLSTLIFTVKTLP